MVQTVNKILVGNKCDMEAQREVSSAEGQELAREYGMKFFETSARSNTNVSEAFSTLSTDVIQRLLASGDQAHQQAGSVNLASYSSTQEKKKGGCCH